MSKKRVFVSYDFDNDSFLKEAIVGQAKNPDSPFDLADFSLKEPLSGNWKEKITPRIKGVDIVVVLCGEKTDTATGVSAELKIARENNVSYFLLKGYSDKNCKKPLAAKADDKMYNWTWQNLKNLIGGAR